MSGASKQNNGTALASTTEVDEKLNVKRKKKKKNGPQQLVLSELRGPNIVFSKAI